MSSNKEKKLAEVANEKLFWSDAKKYVPAFFSPEDSVQKVERYVESWVTNKLIIEQAKKQGEIAFDVLEAKANKLRDDLIIHEYNINYLKKNLDTSVKQESILKYYEQNKNNFVLKEKVVKAYFVKMRQNSPLLAQFKTVFNKNDSTSISELKGISQSQATNYLFSENNWIELSQLISNLPQPLDNQDLNNIINKKKFIKETATDIYFIRVVDLKKEQEIAPLSMKLTAIRNIILNERKIELLQFLKDTTYSNSSKREYK